MLEVVPALTHAEVRRGLLACVLRTKTIPCLVGHDGDIAFTNLLFLELEELLDIENVVGGRYRPTAQAPVEREHQEVQRSLGMLLQEVIRCMPGERGQCVPIVEWIRYNTPSPMRRDAPRY